MHDSQAEQGVYLLQLPSLQASRADAAEDLTHLVPDLLSSSL